jgi:hypothetical protein
LIEVKMNYAERLRPYLITLRLASFLKELEPLRQAIFPLARGFI